MINLVEREAGFYQRQAEKRGERVIARYGMQQTFYAGLGQILISRAGLDVIMKVVGHEADRLMHIRIPDKPELVRGCADVAEPE